MALIPPDYLSAVAVLEDAHTTSDGQEFLPVATGTLLGYATPDQSEAEPGNVRRHVFLATNKHVIEGKTELWIRFNQGATAERYRLEIRNAEGKETFQRHEQFDVAVALIAGPLLRAQGAEFGLLPDEAILDLVGMETEGIVAGDGVFVLGFPMGITGSERKYAIVRAGVIARVDREVVAEEGGFLIDCVIFPGNSGGPVILRPEAMAITGTKTADRSHVIGIVAGYVPYRDVAVSQQTGKPRITFEENSGLASVVPMDPVNQLVQRALAEQEAAKERGAEQGAEAESVPEEPPPELDTPGDD